MNFEQFCSHYDHIHNPPSKNERENNESKSIFDKKEPEYGFLNKNGAEMTAIKYLNTTIDK